eukprot:CAMPEP_0182418536 /NCGR_PEP_ID=MMETSP1167-20130531/2940_1 /TAXON_ID=2988 /ORGANISM="Mallomonas Sp, Strain CCMP3275" /LENGTH=94 /DNA_ID=CAMNT_0024592785 /DNA_START=271 /DNA_END=555 /DNA_ORIENTATION=+
MLSETGRQATAVLGEDLVGSEDNPKEIEIVCKEDPEISVRDISTEESIGANECMVLKIKGPKFNFQLSISCEDTKRAEFQHDILSDNREIRKEL